MIIRAYAIGVLACIGLTALPGCGGAVERIAMPSTVRVMSFNILRDAWARDEYPRWEDRKDRVVAVIRDHQPDVVGLQEEDLRQAVFLDRELKDYTYLTPHHEAGGGLMIRKHSWHVIARGKIDIPDTDDRTRQASWAVLESQRDDRQWAVYNAHYTYRGGPDRRLETSRAIAAHIASNTPRGMPVIVMGDFNATLDEPPMQYLLGRVDGSPVALTDAFSAVHGEDDPRGTIHGFTGKRNEKRIDHVLFNDAARALSATILYDNLIGAYPSDHYPVRAQLEAR